MMTEKVYVVQFCVEEPGVDKTKYGIIGTFKFIDDAIRVMKEDVQEMREEFEGEKIMIIEYTRSARIESENKVYTVNIVESILE